MVGCRFRSNLKLVKQPHEIKFEGKGKDKENSLVGKQLNFFCWTLLIIELSIFKLVTSNYLFMVADSDYC